MKTQSLKVSLIRKGLLFLCFFMTFGLMVDLVGSMTKLLGVDGSITTNRFAIASDVIQTISVAPYQITADGTYQLAVGFAGRVDIANTATNVKVIGSGVQNSNTNIVALSGRTGPLFLTIENVNLFSNSTHGIDFGNTTVFENFLYLSGENRVIGYTNGSGIHVPLGASLTIDVAGGAPFGNLTAKGGNVGAGIGGYSGAAGNITVNSGTIRAEAGWSGGAGIGGGAGGSAGNIVINGGTITAWGFQDSSGYSSGEGAGIGCGLGGNGGTITINNGNITAKGSYGSAGIGGSYRGFIDQVLIRGGMVTATGGAANTPFDGGRGGGAGIGCGGGNASTPGLLGDIFIEGGNVIATGGDGMTGSGTFFGGAGIGGGGGDYHFEATEYAGLINISGGIITATGKSGGAGIGGGSGRPGCNIQIINGVISAFGGAAPTNNEGGGAGIGGGNGSSGGSINIQGGAVTATGGTGSFGGAAGIGGGSVGTGGIITINNAVVTATGGFASAGIGGGGNAFAGVSGGTITLTNSTIIANGGNTAAGIGGGGGVFGSGSGGVITIDGGSVTATGTSAAGIGGGGTNSSSPGAGGTITIMNNPIVIATGTYGADVGNANITSGTTILKDDLGNDLSYVRFAVTYRTAVKPDAIITYDSQGYTTNQNGLTGFFIQKDVAPSITVQSSELEEETQLNIATSSAQTRREAVELSNYKAELLGLVLSSGSLSPGFNSYIYNYDVDVRYSAANFTVRPTAESTSNIKVNGINVANNTNSTAIPLLVGDNQIDIVVTAGNGTTVKTYTLIVNRQEQMPMTISGSFVASNKYYDGSTAATIDINNLILTGLVGGDDVTLNAILAFDQTNVGNSTVRIINGTSLVGAQAGDYSLSLVGAPTDTADILAKELVITADAKGKNYGAVDPALTYQITSGELIGSDVITGALSRVEGEDVGAYAIEQSTLTAGDNYSISYEGTDLTIMPKSLTITAVPQEKVYGDADPVLTYTIETGALIGTDSITGTLNRIAGENAGDYDIGQNTLSAGGNYTIIFEDANLTILPKPLTITVDPKNKLYREVDPEFTYTLTSGELIGTDAITGILGRQAGENVGDYIIGIKTLTAGDNYIISCAGANLTIMPRSLTITAHDNSIVYGEAEPVFTYEISAGELFSGDTLTGELDGGAKIHAGTFTIYLGTLTAGPNYDITYIEAYFTVTPKPVTITMDTLSKVYGEVDPIFTFQIADGVLISELRPRGMSSREVGEHVGTYTINRGTLNFHPNYDVTVIESTFTITPKPITITANPMTKVYGETDPVFTYGITSGQLIGTDSLSGTLSRAPGENVAAYLINQGTLSAGDNYELTFVGDALSIIKKDLIIKADDKSKRIETADPVLTVTYNGFVNGEQADVLNGVLLIERVSGEIVGTYTITASGLTSDHYNIIYTDGVFTITKANKSTSASVPPELQGDNSVTIVREAVLDTEDSSLNTDISPEAFQQAINLLQMSEDVNPAIRIEIKGDNSVTANTLQLPLSALSRSTNDYNIIVSSNIGDILLPSNMIELATVDNGSSVQFTMAYGDKNQLDAQLMDLIGTRPLLELGIFIDGKQVHWSNLLAPVTLSIPYTPTQEELEDPEHITVWYIDSNGNAISIPTARYSPITGKISFTTTHFSSFAVVYSQKTFEDLGQYNWANNQIEVLASKGILKGISEGQYAPGLNVTRADFLYYLIRTLGVDAQISGNFDDISKDSYYYNEIAIAKKLGITNGLGNNRFNPDKSISRQDMVVLTARALRILKIVEQKGDITSLDKFFDKPQISTYALDSVASLVNEALIMGHKNLINPKGNTTRAEVAVFLYRIYNKY